LRAGRGLCVWSGPSPAPNEVARAWSRLLCSQFEEDVFEVRLVRRELVQEKSCRAGDLSDLGRSRARDEQLMRIQDTALEPARAQQVVQPLCLGCDDMRATRRAGEQV